MVELYASTALTSIFVRASDDRALRTTVLQRLSKALFKLKDGLSVVAPAKKHQKASIKGRNQYKNQPKIQMRSVQASIL